MYNQPRPSYPPYGYQSYCPSNIRCNSCGLFGHYACDCVTYPPYYSSQAYTNDDCYDYMQGNFGAQSDQTQTHEQMLQERARVIEEIEERNEMKEMKARFREELERMKEEMRMREERMKEEMRMREERQARRKEEMRRIEEQRAADMQELRLLVQEVTRLVYEEVREPTPSIEEEHEEEVLPLSNIEPKHEDEPQLILTGECSNFYFECDDPFEPIVFQSVFETDANARKIKESMLTHLLEHTRDSTFLCDDDTSTISDEPIHLFDSDSDAHDHEMLVKEHDLDLNDNELEEGEGSCLPSLLVQPIDLDTPSIHVNMISHVCACDVMDCTMEREQFYFDDIYASCEMDCFSFDDACIVIDYAHEHECFHFDDAHDVDLAQPNIDAFSFIINNDMVENKYLGAFTKPSHFQDRFWEEMNKVGVFLADNYPPTSKDKKDVKMGDEEELSFILESPNLEEDFAEVVPNQEVTDLETTNIEGVPPIIVGNFDPG